MFNPYGAYMPFRAMSGAGLLSRINWGSLLSNTQKTLNIVNQAIPIVYQVKPIINNAKTVMRVANELRKPSTTTVTTSAENTNAEQYSNEPTFFI